MGNSESCINFNRKSYKDSSEKGFDKSKEVKNMDFVSRLSSIFTNKNEQKVSKIANKLLNFK